MLNCNHSEFTQSKHSAQAELFNFILVREGYRIKKKIEVLKSVQYYYFSCHHQFPTHPSTKQNTVK